MSTSSQSPPPLSTTPAFKQLAMAINPNIPGEPAAELMHDFRCVVRADSLYAAIEAARGEYLHDDTGTDADAAYNQGVTDAIVAIGKLLAGGAL